MGRGFVEREGGGGRRKNVGAVVLRGRCYLWRGRGRNTSTRPIKRQPVLEQAEPLLVMVIGTAFSDNIE